jgi:5-methylcytosine-specific restriction protein A
LNITLQPGVTIDNQKLQDIFKCSARGGMRRSHRTNSLVLISDFSKAVYEGRWIENEFHYTGMGLTGDQSLSFHQNKTLAESSVNNVDIYLFEVFEQGQYTFIGQVELSGEPYQENQSDKNGRIRKVWIFPLKLRGEYPEIPEAKIIKKRETRSKIAAILNTKELKKRAKFSKKGVGKRNVSSTVFERNEYVAELARRYAKGKCELCEHTAPFADKRGRPFLETHHIEWLSKGGEDIIENTIALCPNCHRKMHILELKEDKEKLDVNIKEFSHWFGKEISGNV